MTRRAATRRKTTPTRAGTLLIIVAGISALLLSLTITFIVNMRADVEESAAVVREAQARIVLIAALQYLQEASRLGWDNLSTPEHEEAFGWADVRDGSAGPKGKSGLPLYAVGNGRFPDIGGKAARFQLHMLEQPPFAIMPTFAPNAAPLDASVPWLDLVKYHHPDPNPAASTWDDFVNGKPQVRLESQARSWFRVYREKNVTGATPIEPATFTITCGAGATQGFRDFDEANFLGYGDLFNNDPSFFAALRAQERILWFRTEWTSAVGGSAMGIRIKDGYLEMPELNQGAYTSPTNIYKGTPLDGAQQQWWANRNSLGSFLWIQRLELEPTNW